jgi:hypothetical protein
MPQLQGWTRNILFLAFGSLGWGVLTAWADGHFNFANQADWQAVVKTAVIPFLGGQMTGWLTMASPIKPDEMPKPQDPPRS